MHRRAAPESLAMPQPFAFVPDVEMSPVQQAAHSNADAVPLAGGMVAASIGDKHSRSISSPGGAAAVARPPYSRTISASSLKNTAPGTSSWKSGLTAFTSARPSLVQPAPAATTGSSKSRPLSFMGYPSNGDHSAVTPGVAYPPHGVRSHSNSATSLHSLRRGDSPFSANGSIASSGTPTGLHRYAGNEEIEASLKQWRNHVFPSLQAGVYVSPGVETPEKDAGIPIIEPRLPSIFELEGTNARAACTIHESGRDFLELCQSVQPPFLQTSSNVDDAAVERDDYAANWRMERVFGQTSDLLTSDPHAEGVWISMWSGSESDGTRMLEFCLMKLPGRPLVVSSPIPMSVLPTVLLQERMHTLLYAFLSHPTVSATIPAQLNPTSPEYTGNEVRSRQSPADPSIPPFTHPFSLIMGPTRLVEAFLLHWDFEFPPAETSNLLPPAHIATSPRPGHASHMAPTASAQSGLRTLGRNETGHFVPVLSGIPIDGQRSVNVRGAYSIAGSPDPSMPQAISAGAMRKLSSASSLITIAPVARTIKPLLHTRVNTIPPAVSLSDGFAVRLADGNDDLRVLTTLFQAFSSGNDEHLDEISAKRALLRAIATQSVWIYHVSSQSFAGLSLIAGFLTVDRQRQVVRYRPDGRIQTVGSVAITAVYSEERYRRRGVAEGLIRAATRYYLADRPDNYQFVSAYIDPRNEHACKLFARVGFGVADKEEHEPLQVRLIHKALIEQIRISKEQSSRNNSTEEVESEAAEEPTARLAAPASSVSTEISDVASDSTQAESNTDAHFTADDDDMQSLLAEGDMPVCHSSEPWQLVTLRKNDNVPTPIARSTNFRLQHARQGSYEGPWA